MIPVVQHQWKGNLAQAREIQVFLAQKVILKPFKIKPETVLAVDVSYSRFEKCGYGVAGLFKVAFDNRRHKFHIVSEQYYTNSDTVPFPYIPGYLSFREIPILLPILSQISERPDLLLVDGAGIAHPRHLGLAAHLGVIFDLPAIGCAKSRLIGDFLMPGLESGAYEYLRTNGKRIGVVLRTKPACRPLFISPGHRCTITDAWRLIFTFCDQYRLPEPLRRVDLMSKRMRKQIEKK